MLYGSMSSVTKLITFSIVNFVICSIKNEPFDDWIRTTHLWYRMRPLYQLSHNHCPVVQFIPSYLADWRIFSSDRENRVRERVCVNVKLKKYFFLFWLFELQFGNWGALSCLSPSLSENFLNFLIGFVFFMLRMMFLLKFPFHNFAAFVLKNWVNKCAFKANCSV